MDVINLLYVGLLGQLTPIIWSLPFILIRVITFGYINLHNVTNTAEQMEILNKFKTIGISSYIYDGKPAGFIITWWFIALVRYEESEWKGPRRNIMILGTHKAVNYLKTPLKDENTSVTSEIVGSNPQYLEAGTNPYNIQWTKRELDLEDMVPSEAQREVIDEIKRVFREKRTYVGYLYGPKGTGKTSIGLLLAKELNGIYTDNFNPTEPGFSMSQLYNYATPTMEQPLIISMDEFDIMLENIHQERIRLHKEIRIEVTNKNGWNKMLDNLPYFYRNVIIILSSNKAPNEINEMDSSYIRRPRITKEFYLPKSIISLETISSVEYPMDRVIIPIERE